jgi:hypothetical protein
VKSHEPIYGLMAEFVSPADLVHATERVRAHGFTCYDAYSPFPVEGLAESMNLRTNLPALVLIGGLLGAATGFSIQYWMNAVDYPINVGGRPLVSWPSWIPVTFETAILFAALTAVVGMLALNGLPKPYHPVFNVKEFDRVTDDRFFLVIESDDPLFDEHTTREFLTTLSPTDVHVVQV